jgi:hypothetical protein
VQERRGEGRGEMWSVPGIVGVAFIGPGWAPRGVAGVTVG